MRRLVGALIVCVTLSGSLILAAPAANAAACTWVTAVPYAWQDSRGYYHVTGAGYFGCTSAHTTLYLKVGIQDRLPGQSTWNQYNTAAVTEHNVKSINGGDGVRVTAAVFPVPYGVTWRSIILWAYACDGTTCNMVYNVKNKVDGYVFVGPYVGV